MVNLSVRNVVRPLGQLCRYPTTGEFIRLNQEMQSRFQFSVTSIFLAVTNAALLLGHANLAPSLFSDIDACDVSKAYSIFLSIGFWRFQIARKDISAIRATWFRCGLIMIGSILMWFFAARLFGSSRSFANFSLMVVFVFPITACSMIFLDARGVWNTPIWFLAKIAIELAILFPLWIFGFALLDAYAIV